MRGGFKEVLIFGGGLVRGPLWYPARKGLRPSMIRFLERRALKAPDADKPWKKHVEGVKDPCRSVKEQSIRTVHLTLCCN